MCLRRRPASPSACVGRCAWPPTVYAAMRCWLPMPAPATPSGPRCGHPKVSSSTLQALVIAHVVAVLQCMILCASNSSPRNNSTCCMPPVDVAEAALQLQMINQVLQLTVELLGAWAGAGAAGRNVGGGRRAAARHRVLQRGAQGVRLRPRDCHRHAGVLCKSAHFMAQLVIYMCRTYQPGMSAVLDACKKWAA
jgi:hypothetical protein